MGYTAFYMEQVWVVTIKCKGESAPTETGKQWKQKFICCSPWHSDASGDVGYPSPCSSYRWSPLCLSFCSWLWSVKCSVHISLARRVYTLHRGCTGTMVHVTLHILSQATQRPQYPPPLSSLNSLGHILEILDWEKAINFSARTK